MLLALLLAGGDVALLYGLEVVEDASWGRMCDVEAAGSVIDGIVAGIGLIFASGKTWNYLSIIHFWARL